MQFLKNKINSFFLFSIVFLAVSCTSEVKFEEVADYTQPFKITMLHKNERTMLGEKTEYSIEPGSEQYIRLEEWLKGNDKGWKKTIAMYDNRSVISQKNLEINYMGYFVSIAFTDKNGKSYHYSKTVDVGALDFLFD